MSADNTITPDVDRMQYRLMSTAGMRAVAEELLERHPAFDEKTKQWVVPRLTDEAVQALRAAYTQAADDVMSWACLLTDHRRGKRTMQPQDVLLGGAIALPHCSGHYLERNENTYGENALWAAYLAKTRRRAMLRCKTAALKGAYYGRR